jgi:hypothetical protein
MLTINQELQNNRIYAWHVSSSNDLGFGGWSETFAFKTEETTDIKDGGKIPKSFQLYQNYPNPFNPETFITFDIPKSGVYSVKVYNLLGEMVSVIGNRNYLPGTYKIMFGNNSLSSGIYIYQLIGDGVNISKKMVLLR